MTDLNLLKLNFQNLFKLSQKGKIVKVYHAMYKEAEKLANKEFELFYHKEAVLNKGDVIKWFETVMDYRDKRFNYHYNEMKKLFEKFLETQSKDK